jgi:cytochrome c oxidase assembly factor CtaG
MWPVTPRGEAGRAAARAAVGRRLAPTLGRGFVAASTMALILLAAGPVVAHGDVPAEPPDLWILLTAWSFDPAVAIPLIAGALGWLWAVRRIDQRHPHNPVPPLRVASFLLGLATIAVALQSGIERYDTTLFSIHMVQHLLLMLVAPPLLLLGAPVTVLLRVVSPWLRRRVVLPILHSAPFRFVSHPVVAWLAFTAVVWGTHFSPLFDIALDDDNVHQLEHVLFLVSALFFWFPVVGADPSPNRLGYPGRALYLLLQMPPSSFLAMAILFDDQPLYDHYQELGAPYGVTALADQQSAAGIMWVSSDLILIAVLMLVVGAWLRHDERRTLEVERRIDAERAALAARADALAARRAGRQAGTGEASSSR